MTSPDHAVEGADLAKTPALPHRTAIVVVHGVQPHPRYEIQDSCASNLCNQLNQNAPWNAGKPWVGDVTQPRAKPGAALQATLSRVHREGDVTGAQPFFDVVEAYWSPLDKGKANFAGVLSWLLRALVVPLDTTAVYAASTRKTLYDLGFVLGAAFFAFLAVAGAFYLFLIAANQVSAVQGCPLAGCIPLDPVVLLKNLVPASFNGWTLGSLAVTAAGAFLAAQAFKGAFQAFFQGQTSTPAHRRKRSWLIVAILALGCGLMFAGGFLLSVPHGPDSSVLWQSLRGAVFFVLAAGLFEVGRTVVQSFVVNFFQDVMIYTTRDENADFYKMRGAILDLVSDQLESTCAPTVCDGHPYDRVFLLAHSLGSTIGLDAILRFYQRCKQGSLDWTTFARLRAFVTFGSPLEKTKYFFDVQSPSPSAAMEMWRNDAYGALFTLAPSALDAPVRGAATGIFWTNYWYCKDAIANALDTYRSFLRPGDPPEQAAHIRAQIEKKTAAKGDLIPKRICRNERRDFGFVWPAVLPHGEYLGDPMFWKTRGAVRDADIDNAEDYRSDRLGVLDIVARLIAVRSAPQAFDATDAAAADWTAAAAAPVTVTDDDVDRRADPVDARRAGQYRDRYLKK